MLPCQSQSCPSISALGGAAGENQEYGRGVSPPLERTTSSPSFALK